MSEKTYSSNLANGDLLDNNKQLVITRANMTSDFTNDEFQGCTDAMSDGFSVVIHFSSGGLNEVALTKIGTDGALVFTANSVDGKLYTYKVAPGATHSITATVFDIAPTYVNESYTGPDAHIDYDGTLLSLTCEFDIDAVQFSGLVHVQFQKPNNNFMVTQYVNGTSNSMTCTASTVSGVTHFTMPVIIEQGTFKVKVSFDSVGAPSSVKFDLIGFNH